MPDNTHEAIVTSQTLDRYLAGECTVEERERIDVLVRADVSHAETLKRLTMQPLHPSEAADGFEVEKGWNRVKKAVRYSEEGKGRAKIESGRLFLGYSAMVAVLLTAICLKYVPGLRSNPEVKTYATAVGQRANITLPSGAQVILAPASKLVINGNYIDLNGQALFTVRHNSKVPFTVRAGNSTTRVLGTTFAVRAYSADSSVRVFVTEGKVSVGDNTILVAGDAVKISPNGRIAPLSDLDLTTALGWTEGKLVFRRANLKAVLRELNLMYNVRFQVGDSMLESREITMTFMEGNLQSTIYELSELLNAKYVVQGSTITFVRK